MQAFEIKELLKESNFKVEINFGNDMILVA